MLYLIVSDIVVSVMLSPYFKMYYARDASTCGLIIENAMNGLEALISASMIFFTYLEKRFISSEQVK